MQPIVSLAILRDVLLSSKNETTAPSRRITDFLSRLKLFPVVHFPASDVTVSLWVLLLVGLATGYLAGTIGVGGFIGVPAMIYVFGMPTAVAAGTELFLAMFMGARGALNYAFQGLVDLRLVMLLYLGSLMGIHIGAYGTKVVKEVLIRLVTAIIILLCVLSRAIAIPMYLRQRLLQCLRCGSESGRHRLGHLEQSHGALVLRWAYSRPSARRRPRPRHQPSRCRGVRRSVVPRLSPERRTQRRRNLQA